MGNRSRQKMIMRLISIMNEDPIPADMDTDGIYALLNDNAAVMREVKLIVDKKSKLSSCERKMVMCVYDKITEGKDR